MAQLSRCIKKAYPTKKLAEAKLETIKAEPFSTGKQPCRAYQCERCKLWHLTSMSKEEQRKVVHKRGAAQARRIQSAAEYFAKRKGWDLEN